MVRSDSQGAQFAHDSESLIGCETEVIGFIGALRLLEAIESADGEGSHEAIIDLKARPRSNSLFWCGPRAGIRIAGGLIEGGRRLRTLLELSDELAKGSHHYIALLGWRLAVCDCCNWRGRRLVLSGGRLAGRNGR
jgi:hypothetical protein